MHRRKGFTLIELLVVIAIIAILAAILFPVFTEARENARKTQCLSNMKQLLTGFQMYNTDYGQMPYYWYSPRGDGIFISWMEMIHPYLKNEQIFLCPSGPTLPAAYYDGCRGAPTRVVSHYTWAAWLYFDYYDWYSTIMFAGFPVPCKSTDPVTGSICASPVRNCPTRRPWSACVSMDQVSSPANSALLVEGFFISYFTPYAEQTTKFGSACVIGLDPDENNKNINRHRKGGNVGFVDGHVRWMPNRLLHRDNSAQYRYGGTTYPLGRYFQVQN
jgi:prepilin-type N-terminal cleavage/methylation domain-containing protein/prepilin-type processing-associated H-X9-DG protein